MKVLSLFDGISCGRVALLEKADPTGWNKHTEFHWSKSLCGLRFNYWPSGRKAMFNGVVYKGIDDIKELEKSIERGF